MVLYRLPFDLAADWRRERRGVWLTDLALVAVYGGLGFVFGFGTVALVQIPVMLVASIVGVWLFTVQHRGETVAWAREAQWSGLTASLEGTTWLDLPRILQWFTGNIGLHHIHHLNPRIPNYRLQSCQDAVGGLAGVERTSLGGAFRAMFCTLWDEPAHRMVTPRMAMAGMSQAAAAG